MAQPQLRPDNIDEVVAAMTLEEKAALLVGDAWGTRDPQSATDFRQEASFKLSKARSWAAHEVLVPEKPIEEIKVK